MSSGTFSTENFRVLMAGSYDIDTYDRGRILYKGLKMNGVDTELALNQGRGRHKRLASRLLQGGFDVVVVNGKPNLLVAWLLKPLHRKPIVFDVFISDFDTLVMDRRVVKQGSLKASLLWWGDRIGCLLPDVIIHDTDEHVDYFVQAFGARRSKFHVVPVGADDTVFTPGNARHRPFLVLFHGTYIPLQGTQHIIQAAKLLERHEDIRFELTGDGQMRSAAENLAASLRLKNVTFKGMTTVANLAADLRRADAVLGIFGTTPKAQRVIPNKAYQCIAARKPLITADTPASRRVFSDGENALLVPPGDARAIADAVLRLRRDSRLAARIAAHGHGLFVERFTPRKIGARLSSIIKGR
jgi:glycosyltransferase involved in cell wall biosynthesis